MPDELRSWVADPAHGLVQTDSAGTTTVQCSYRPPDLLAAQDLRNARRPLTRTVLDSARRAYAHRSHFALSLSQNGTDFETAFAADPTQYAAVVQYLSAGIAADCYLAIPGRDSIAATAALNLRQYGTTGRTTVLLIFDTSAVDLATAGCHLTFVGQRVELPTYRFAFTAKNLGAIPALALTN